MKRFIKLFMILIIIFIVTGCRVNNGFIKIPEFTDFTNHDELFTYELNTNKDLYADINVCTTRFEFLIHDESNIKVEVAYDDQSLRNKINFSFSDDDLLITKTDQSSKNCSFIKKIDSYVRISLPKNMNVVTIDINSYNALANFDNFNSTSLTYKHVNGDIKIANANLLLSNIKTINGDVDVDTLSGSKIEMYTTNGKISVQNASLSDSITSRLTNGDITVNEIKAKDLISSSTNGSIEVNKSEIYQSAALTTTNGSIKVTNLNEKITSQITNQTTSAKTVNGSIEFKNVYVNNSTLTTVNGSIKYINANKDFFVNSVIYSKVNGSTEFDLNGNVKKL